MIEGHVGRDCSRSCLIEVKTNLKCVYRLSTDARVLFKLMSTEIVRGAAAVDSRPAWTCSQPPSTHSSSDPERVFHSLALINS